MPALGASQFYWVLFSLYWAQGLPVGFMTHALPVLLRHEGLSLAQIGGFGLLMLPWSIKVLWAPWVDHYGSYRRWILPLQVASVLSLLALSYFSLEQLHQPVGLWSFFVVLLLMNLFAATQDIATDGLAVSNLKGQGLNWGNSLQVLGSRLGFIVGGGLLLWWVEDFGWQYSFWLLAALVAINTWPIYRYQIQTKPTDNRTAFGLGAYWQYVKESVELRAWFWVLLSFKVADGLAGPLLKPLMVDLGLSLSQIGIYITMLGAVAALMGALLAGLLLRYLSAKSALLLFSALKILSLLGYVVLAGAYQQQKTVASTWIYVVNAVEDLVSAMLLVAMLSLVMRYCRQAHAATDFTLQVALMATVSGLLYSSSGLLGDWLGYFAYLMLICVVACVCIWPILRWQPTNKHI